MIVVLLIWLEEEKVSDLSIWWDNVNDVINTPDERFEGCIDGIIDCKILVILIYIKYKWMWSICRFIVMLNIY